MSEVTGLVSGLTGAALSCAALLVALAAAVRVLIVLRRPGKGRWSRAIAAGAGVLGAVGLALFVASELAPDPVRHLLDDGARGIAAGALAIAGWVTLRKALRRAPAPADAPLSPTPGGPAGAN